MKNKKPWQRQKMKIHKFEKKAGFCDEHHIRIPSSRGGDKNPSNLLLIDAYRHDAWHLLFMNKTLSEVILLLHRVNSIKIMLRSLNSYYKYAAFNLLFGKKTLEEIIALLERVRHLKRGQHIILKLSA